MSTGTATRGTALAALGGASLLLLAACGGGGSMYGGGGSTYGGGSSPSQAAHTVGKITVAKTPAGKVLVDPRAGARSTSSRRTRAGTRRARAPVRRTGLRRPASRSSGS